MKTTHKVFYQDAREIKDIDKEGIDLMITSPPYPMIEMWDELFSKQNPEIREAIDNKKGELAFELMHKELDKVWSEVYRVLKDGGIACINIGDATRTLNGKFQIYTNHARILNSCIALGFHALPSILWVKETNKPDKFMGSGMLPVGAYVTLEHEHILVLRKNGKRDFKKEEKIKRQNSAFFWEERNIWFSDKWKDIGGVFQKLNHEKLRERSGAYPIELAYRLINMFSIYGDIVLDPFLGTGTTTFASMISGRSSIGIEIDKNFKEIIDKRLEDAKQISKQKNLERLKNHIIFIQSHEKEIKHQADFYKFPIKTRQEKGMVLRHIKEMNKLNDGLWEAIHEKTEFNQKDYLAENLISYPSS